MQYAASHMNMLRQLTSPCLLLLVVVVIAAAPASADCEPLFRLLDLPFDGQALPAHAELRVIAPGEREFVLILADQTERLLAVVDDEIGQLVELPADLSPLPPGDYSFVIRDRSGVFSVVAADDDDAPAAPVVAVGRVPSRFPLPLPFDECPVRSSDGSIFSVDGTTPGEVILVNGRVVARGFDGTTSFTTPLVRGTVEVRLRDLAGNESETTTVDAGSGCGCETSSPASGAGVLALLLIVRRRRR